MLFLFYFSGNMKEKVVLKTDKEDIVVDSFLTDWVDRVLVNADSLEEAIDYAKGVNWTKAFITPAHCNRFLPMKKVPDIVREISEVLFSRHDISISVVDRKGVILNTERSLQY